MLLLWAFPDIRAKAAEGQVESNHLAKGFSKLTFSLDLWSDQTSTQPESFTVNCANVAKSINRNNGLQVPVLRIESVTLPLLQLHCSQHLLSNCTTVQFKTALQSSTQIQGLSFQQNTD